MENVENDNIIEIYLTENNINISNNISDNDNILKHITSKSKIILILFCIHKLVCSLKILYFLTIFVSFLGKLDSIIEIGEESSMDCEKENYPSVSKSRNII